MEDFSKLTFEFFKYDDESGVVKNVFWFPLIKLIWLGNILNIVYSKNVGLISFRF